MNNEIPKLHDEILALKDISISFNKVKILHDANFSLKKHEIHAIVGKNGAGKSTFMKVLSGVYTPDSGGIYIDNKNQPISKKVKKNRYTQVAMVYQDLSLIPSLTVLQNIFLVHHPFNKHGILHDKKAKKHAENILEQVGLSHVPLHRVVEHLSVGEAQLLEIAKAIAARPKILVFDEPTASLSHVEVEKLFETIRKLRAQGLSIVYITHYLEDVMTLCDRVTVLRNGEVISTSHTKDTTISHIVSDMLGEDTNNIPQWHHNDDKNDTHATPLLDIKDASTAHVGPLSLTAYPNEIIGIAGLLGSGRTEFFRMLCGLDPLVSGELAINGEKTLITSPLQAKKHGISLVPEERRTQGLALDFNIEENIAIPNLRALCTHGMIDSEKKSVMADDMIKNLLIKTTGRNQVVRYLSGGNQQKVVVAKCLASNPRILLLDDPTFGVDIHAKIEIMKIIHDYVKKGNIALFVSSEFSEISNFCNRIYVIKKGTITTHTEHNNITEEELLQLVQ